MLAIALIALPVGLFAGVEIWTRSAPQGAGLGDVSAMTAIVAGVQALADKGDLAGAALRVTDLETAWDDAQPVLQPRDPVAWGALDGRIDAVLSALRATQPQSATVSIALADLSDALAHPAAVAATGAVAQVAGIAVTDAGGHPLPCEAMLTTLREALAAATPQPANAATISDLQARATERCNADDDAHADAFSAQALALVTK
ncbi:hypothetical protein [Fuscibacter oryzae]|uniref:Uncharacterized protein n=1 Tax=Fuscibacter oryzae TaxID=2803939 RepID=A0A8J7MR65_9RHOB|nr:hypothetical protein [Fuscibacter oryzae]MBL4928698.1 hypothetical protein [Fuscibacter oryzae]